MRLSHIIIFSLLSITLLSNCHKDCGCRQLTVSSPSLSVSSSNDDDVLPVPGAPKFEDYPTTTWSKHSAPLQLKGKERRYRTTLKEAYAKGPNFAGHLTVEVIGFGTGPRCSYIMDHRTGQVIKNPSGVETTDEGMFVSCGSPAHKLESNLLIISPPYQWMWKIYMEEKAKDPTIRPIWADCQTMYMVWDGKQFKKVFEINIEQAMLSVESKELIRLSLAPKSSHPI